MAIQFLNTVQVDTSVLYVDTANDRVGIGTTSPDALLHVRAATNVTGTIEVQGGKATVTSAGEINSELNFGSNDASATGGIGGSIKSVTENTNGAYVGMSFYTAKQGRTPVLEEAMRIDQDGKVGIGTDGPGAKLDIINSGLSTMFRLSNTEANATTKYSAIVGRHYTNTEENVTGMLITSSSNALSGQTVSIGGGISDANAVNNIILYTAANNITLTGTERMRITSAGNVGIGTTSPSYQLQVTGDSSSSPLLQVDDDGDAYLQIKPDASTIFKIGDIAGLGNEPVIVGSYDDLRFNNLGSTTMTVNNLNRVGIGTTSPGRLLTLSGSVSPYLSLVSDTTGGEPSVFFGDTADDNEGRIVYSNSQDYMSLWTAATEKIRITSAGDVGIGTTSPTTKLHVNGNLRLGTTGTFLISQSPFTTTTFYANAGNGSTISFGVPSNYQQNVTVQGDFSTQSGSTSSYLGTKRFGSFNNRLDPSGDNYLNSGDLGIGTTSPSYKLDVSGEGRFTGDLRCLSLIQTSQRDQKENINDIDKSKAKAIPFKEYTYKSSIDGSSRKRYGVVVEDIEDDYPELVHTDADGVKGVNYIDLLVKRVAELEKELEDISLTPGANGADGTNGTNGSPGAKGATGSAGSNGKNGSDGNSHLSNITSIGINGKSGQLEIVIGLSTYKFNPDK